METDLKRKWEGFSPNGVLMKTLKDYLSEHIFKSKCYLIRRKESKHKMGHFCLLINILCTFAVHWVRTSISFFFFFWVRNNKGTIFTCSLTFYLNFSCIIFNWAGPCCPPIWSRKKLRRTWPAFVQRAVSNSFSLPCIIWLWKLAKSGFRD